jgi:hypothetical protein
MDKPKQPASRIATLKERVEAAERSNAPTSDVPFRGKSLSLHRIRVEIDFPLYRIQSGRTHRAQIAHLDKYPRLPKDFFSDPEDTKVQHAQHEILVGMIDERDLATDLRQRGQMAPLVLTRDGYVVDGNRRLAALRERKEGYADAVVLPADAQAHEIYETEIELQMQRETKAPYNWIDKALHIEYGIKELDEKPEQVARRMRLSKEDITWELEKLTFVRQYLAWLGENGKYHKVPSAGGGHMEQAFEDLAQRFSSTALKRKKEAERRLIRDACFQAIKQEAGYQQIRNIIKQFSQNPARISQKLRERRPVRKAGRENPKSTSRAEQVDPKKDPLRALAKAGPSTLSGAAEDLIEAVEDPNAASMILDIVDEMEAEEREAKRQQQPLQRIERAIADLKLVVLGEDVDNLDAIAKALGRLSEEVDRLSKRVEKLSAHS